MKINPQLKHSLISIVPWIYVKNKPLALSYSRTSIRRSHSIERPKSQEYLLYIIQDTTIINGHFY